MNKLCAVQKVGQVHDTDTIPPLYHSAITLLRSVSVWQTGPMETMMQSADWHHIVSIQLNLP